MYCQTIRTVRDIFRHNRARIATCSLRTPTDRQNYSIDDGSIILDSPREAYTSPFKVMSPLLPAGPSSQRFGAPRRDEAVLAQDPLERRLAGSSSFETAQLHPRSTQRPGPRLASKAVDNPQPPSHGCRPVKLVHAEVGPQGLLCL